MKIGEFSRQTGLSIHTIHYYEKIGIIRKNSKDKSGHRIYTDYDIEWAGFISCLKSTEMPISQILHFIKLIDKGESSAPERLAILHKQRKHLENKISELNSHMSHIDYKIQNFEKIYKKINRPS